MTISNRPAIDIRGAKTNNLKNISLSIPHHKLIVVTGISGSGKSSLVSEVIAKEGQRRYFETLPTFARIFAGKLNRPEVDSIEGLSPVIAIGQKTAGVHARSTVGTISDIYDLLRLLYARTGKTELDIELSRALFSFNAEIGKCKRCKGIGKEEQIDLDRLITAPEKTIREGALAPTLPTGYIMYSQVTIDVLDDVCRAEGFDVDIPWRDLTDNQRHVILYGSDKIKVPFGKHSLASRLKWTGIKAKPREEGHYKGMIPIMSDILRRDRNANILKYVHAVTCPSCQGNRLTEEALTVTVHDLSIANVVKWEVSALASWIQKQQWTAVGKAITDKLIVQLDLLTDLGLGHLTIDRSARSLRASEIQRLRIANQIMAPLSDVLYIFDEPSIGLHPAENQRLIHHLRRLVQKGNTVIVVEHDLDTIRSADHIIEIGPRAGADGGEVIYNGPMDTFISDTKLQTSSPTYRALLDMRIHNPKVNPVPDSEYLTLQGCHERNLRHIDVRFQLGCLNVVSGKSGSGKSSLVKETLLRVVQQNLDINTDAPIKISHARNLDKVQHVIFVDHTPIGRTPRSNPATYLGISDHIRNLFATLPESKSRGYTRSRFSFNNKGGRCDTCHGAGKTQIGMHFLGNVDLVCGTCNGDRFNRETLEIKYHDHSMSDVYKLSIDAAAALFADEKKVMTGLTILQSVGLGYLRLGQSSTTLSGGEAQRIKIANQLQKRASGNTLYIIIEPSIGLHRDDIGSLLQLFDTITDRGNTIVAIEQDDHIIRQSDWHIELGPDGGNDGGTIIHQGSPMLLTEKATTDQQGSSLNAAHPQAITLRGVTTNGLKNIDVSIPKNQLTVVTGVSGSGKSSLVYDTLFAEANARFTESLSTYHRSFLQQNNHARISSYSGLAPAIGINRRGGNPSNRSTVGTLSGIYDGLRLLYSRISQVEGHRYTAQHFSYNHHLGACLHCGGLGLLQQCDPEEIIVSPDKSIFDGAISTNKALQYYADPNGQFIATLREVAQHYDWNLDRPWFTLTPEIQDAILYGTGDTAWNVTWHYQTKMRSGTQSLTAKWLGLCHYINEEYQRKIHNKNIKHLQDLLHDVMCPTCHGSRLKAKLLKPTYRGTNIYELTKMSISDSLALLSSDSSTDDALSAISAVVLPPIISSMRTIIDLGLGYLSLDRVAQSLSGGERQCILLAGHLSSHLYGVTYVLDEPTIGLDTQRIIVLCDILRALVSRGNTVVVVEHDPTFIQKADHIIELGPGAGRLGGEVVYQGSIKDIANAKDSVTYRMLHSINSRSTIARPSSVPTHQPPPISIKGAMANNLKDIDVALPSGLITTITGVSGSGKSSLIRDVLYRSWIKGRPILCETIAGLEQYHNVVFVDQQIRSMGRLSTPATITGIMDPLRALFAKTDTATQLGLKRADFSYQSKRGRCPACSGHGAVRTSLDFMSDIWLTCDVCKGLRYHDIVLSCTYQGINIGESLQMTVSEAMGFFDQPALLAKLSLLHQVGVGHLLLGQSAQSLSGGEAQRLKLATSLSQKRTGATLYLLDEPSTGLHYFDILQLISVCRSIIDTGDTIVMIEHNSTLIDNADVVVALGPGSGDDGGEVVRMDYL